VTAFKWTVVALWILGALLCIRDAARHGQPKGFYDGRFEALGAAIAIALAAWALAVLP
jgi:hypothetical protein